MDRRTVNLIHLVIDKSDEERLYIESLKREHGVLKSPEVWASEAMESILDRARNRDKYVLCRYLEALDYDDLERVESAMLFGRGDFGSYSSALKYVKDGWGCVRNKDGAIGYIYGKAPYSLIDYLQCALRKSRNVA